MTDSSRGYQQFFAEMKRRRVLRVMAVYGIVGFVLVQIVDLAVPALLLPEWTYRFVALILLLGFPVAIVLAWAFESTPGGIKRTDEASPGELQAIISAPASQRWPAGALALVGVTALLAGAWFVGTQTAADPGTDVRLTFVDPADDPRPSIAVLPFVNMSADEEQKYFSDGMTEEILNVLAKIKDLKVAARTSTFALRDRELTAMQWGDTLRVAYLVEGSVRKAGDQVRITAQLIDTSDGSHLWSESYTRPLLDVFRIQSEIAEAIARELRVPLGLDNPDALVRPTADLEAYDLYLAGREQMRQRGDGITEAVKLFEAAIARDSTWAPAWAGLAESQALVVYYDGVNNDSASWAGLLGAAETAALRALELDPGNASAAVALGNVYRDRWDWDEAEDAYIRALTMDPDNGEAHQQYAEYLTNVGRLGEALQAAERALALDRLPIRLNAVGYMSAYNGRLQDAIDYLEEAVQLITDDQMVYPRNNLRWAYMQAGRWADWWTIIVDRMERGDTPEVAAEFRAGWPTPGPPPPGLEIDSLPWFGPFSKARIWLAIERPEKALDQLERGYSNLPPFGESEMLFRPGIDPIRDDPRFQALLAKRGLAGRVPIRAEQP